jgi:diguanylate cyclase (GGDEF)-like protein
MDTIVAGVMSLFFSWHISKLQLGLEISTNMLEEERNKYHDQSIIDELTQLRNRRDFMNTFRRYLSNYRSSDDWLCIAICDIDFFKNYNDHYGHPMGDECLRGIGRVMNKLKENMGVYTARVGGEEFALLWFEKDISNIDSVVANFTELIGNLKIPHEKSTVSEFITMSMGIYVERCGASSDTKALYDLADKALYTAKESGRNCTIVSGDGIAQYKIARGTSLQEAPPAGK